MNQNTIKLTQQTFPNISKRRLLLFAYNTINKYMKILRIPLVLSIIILVSGCMFHRIPEKQIADTNTVDIMLSEAAASVSKSLVELSKIQKANQPKKKKYLSKIASKDLYGLATIDWSGPIEPLVTHLAKTSRYKFEKKGKEPTLPIIISLNKKNTPIHSILNEIHLLARNKASINVNSKRKIIELRYA